MPSGAKPKPSEFTREVGSIIRARLTRKNVSATALAEAVGVSPSQLSKMLRGERHIDLDQLDVMAYVLGMELKDVITEAEEETEARFNEFPHMIVEL